jgi:SAM-dependent methyltransferase
MPGPEDWASVAAALPQRDRLARETPFWRSLVNTWGWRTVLDAGCGAGFHLRLLRATDVDVVGFDLAFAALREAPRGMVMAADLLRPGVHAHIFDAVLCLGNTISLLADRHAQRQALGALALALKPGGVLLLQGEDAGALVSSAPQARVRTLADGSFHLRVFVRRGARVQMLAGIARPGMDSTLATSWLLPTSPAALRGMARRLGLAPVALPAQPPAGPSSSWWWALRAPQS